VLTSTAPQVTGKVGTDEWKGTWGKGGDQFIKRGKKVCACPKEPLRKKTGARPRRREIGGSFQARKYGI